MKANFLKRVLAFCFDYFILTLVLSFITVGFNTSNESFYTEISNISKEYNEGNISVNEYNDKLMKLEYEYQKDNLPVNIINIVLFIGYFIVFGYLNKGQTLGKKIFKIRVVNDDGSTVKLSSLIIRSLFIYGIITSLYSVISINFLNMKDFNYSVSVVSVVESMILIICTLMMLYKKDGRGLHDIIAKTNVIGEER